MKPMELRYLGHAALRLRAADQTTLIIDPYNPGGFSGRMGYAPIPYHADAVVCSHAHLDHAAIDDLPNRPHVMEGDACFGPFAVQRHRAFHDEYEGRRRGGAVDILEIQVDGLRVVHLSDVGHSPTPALIEALRAPDILCLPVGGNFTIGAAQAYEWLQRLAPTRCVPIHAKTPRCLLDLLETGVFEAYIPATPSDAMDRQMGSFIEVDSAMITFEEWIAALAPEC
ncbi:MBL fold metallo-hydrolase [Bradymonas sediminis]|uniref:Uncharacterized protein n=1 Tax=Bradymonas sediminis TaxID=1548548 RepID=A0A2Z4FJJ0_9DELT|nr:MBL fold metallo-hydrolase [Bradymonas sediminis]AWV89103.1 hypothetical protein DN745_07045 [Bradymonas sediminis]TDP64432.1 L-ascorbate metabolism protein UlaG (beta-lactamase superfamily) [Bradymonas sediminis]